MNKALFRSAYLAAALAFGCNAEHVPVPNYPVEPPISLEQNQSVEPPEAPIRVSYVAQENGISVPVTDWDRGETRYLQLNQSGFLDRQEQTEGRIEHNGQMYDCRMDLIDSNNDGAFDLARLTVDYRIRRHRIWRYWGRLEQGRVIIQDQNYDGITDVMWRDIYDSRRRGIDDIYEYQSENEGGDAAMDYFIDHWILFVRAPR